MTSYRNPDTYLEGTEIMIDKEIGWTSFDVVNKIRVALRDYLGIRKIKVGHAGTLDPLASGLVIICTGKATKQIRQWQDLQKTYEAALKFGETTPSYDLETAVDHTLPWDHITREDFEKALERFTGEIDQVPPVFSAKSIGGKRAYNYARKGKTVELKPARVTINRLNILSYRLPEVKLMIECSKGTYIRALARDLGEALNSGAHLTALRRLQIGTHHVSDAMTVKNFEKRLKQM